MLDENLTPDERGELLKLLRDTIAADRYPLSRRIRNLKAALPKLDPQPQRRRGGSTTQSGSGSAEGDSST